MSILKLKPNPFITFNRETIGGLLLLLATVLALWAANSPWADEYHHFLTDLLEIKWKRHFTLSLTIEQWINDGLMVIFFLVAGLELKREVLVGELSEPRRAALPILAAFGGFVVPALIFISLNAGTPTAHGWGIPMATDIAYCLGILGLLGNRVPKALKLFMVALAVADDLGAILIIALFYSHEIQWMFLGMGMSLFLVMWIMNRSGIKNLIPYLLGGVFLWYCFLLSGIHPTIAGVLFALCIPINPILDGKRFSFRLQKHMKKLKPAEELAENPLESEIQSKTLHKIKKDTERSRPPVLKLENALVRFNSFVILPVFAFANAGVALDVSLGEVVSQKLGLGIILGLVVGKMIGISLFSWLSNQLGWTYLPPHMTWKHLVGASALAGIGFTMSLFITNLAFQNPELIKVAKISILFSSLIAAIAGVVFLSLQGKKTQ